MKNLDNLKLFSGDIMAVWFGTFMLLLFEVIIKTYPPRESPFCQNYLCWNHLPTPHFPTILVKNILSYQVSQCGRMLHKSIGGGRTRSPLKSVQLARQSLAQVAQTSSNQINLGQQRWAGKEKPSSNTSQRFTSVNDGDVSLILESSPLGSSPSRSSPMGSSPPKEELRGSSSLMGSSSRLLESSASVAIVPSKKQPTSGKNEDDNDKDDDSKWQQG